MALYTAEFQRGGENLQFNLFTRAREITIKHLKQDKYTMEPWYKNLLENLSKFSKSYTLKTVKYFLQFQKLIAIPCSILSNF